MAQIPSDELVAAIQAQTAQDIEEKRALQELEGKTFVADPYGPGVIPEVEWQERKEA